MIKRQETIADIVAELRSEPFAEDGAKPWLHYLADRIEAAWKRERELGAEAAQICGELGEAIGRASCGNAVAMREALMAVLKCISLNKMRVVTMDCKHNILNYEKQIKAALSAPPRNCDVGTDREQCKRFERFCKHAIRGTCGHCPASPTMTPGFSTCTISWGLLPYTAEGGEGEGTAVGGAEAPRSERGEGDEESGAAR